MNFGTKFAIANPVGSGNALSRTQHRLPLPRARNDEECHLQAASYQPGRCWLKLNYDTRFWTDGCIHVLRHPFFYVTDVDGWFKIENVPPGDYKLESRHEILGKQSMTRSALAGELATVGFAFSPT